MEKLLTVQVTYRKGLYPWADQFRMKSPTGTELKAFHDDNVTEEEAAILNRIRKEFSPETITMQVAPSEMRAFKSLHQKTTGFLF